jgi:hypothetical protein
MNIKSSIVRLVAVLFAMSLMSVATAQDISSSVRGTVTDSSGAGVSSARVTVTHDPTGTRRVVETTANSSFAVSGLRPGGPYTVLIESDSHRGASFEDVYLTVAESLNLSAELSGGAMEEIVVLGSAIESFSNNGSQSTFNRTFIEESAAFNRDLKDIIRRNPLAVVYPGSDTPLSIAGINPAYNSLTVDGVRQNDDFGLNDNGYPSQRSPLSLETVEQLSVDVSPFSPRYGGFSGGQINVVTKSGTNDFHGSVFWENIDSSRSGTPRHPDGSKVDLEFEEETYGGYISGPIIRDKLFFLASYEYFETPTAIEWGPTGSSAPNEANVSEADLQQVVDIANSVYGVNAGNWNKPAVEEDEKILVKFDWNINDDHRAALTYQRTEGNALNNLTSSRFELRLSSHWYNRAELLETYAVHLFSNWTDRFSTEFKYVDKSVENTQAASDLSYGDVIVETASGDVAFGPDQFRHANQLDNSTTQIVLHGNYDIGDHSLGFGIDHEEIDIFNVFANSSLGVWEFSSIADFQNRTASFFDYRNAFTNNWVDAGASFTIGSTAYYIEDSWSVTPDLTLDFGIRFEQVLAKGKPAENANFNNRYGFANTENLDGATNTLPRFGFDWLASDTIRVYGGIGKYGGGRPNVWISNSYANDGVTFTTFDDQVVDPNDYLTNVDLTSIPQSVQDNMLAGDGSTNSIQPGFDVPSDWRYKLGVEWVFGDDWTTNFDVTIIDSDEGLHWTDLARVDSGTTTAGGRPIYTANDPAAPNRTDFMLTNAKGGKSTLASVSLSKSFDNGFSFFTSYANQDTEEGNPGTSSRAVSNYQFNAAFDRQFPTFGPASYEIEHRFVLDLRYSKAFFSDYETRFNLFFERRSGVPFTWTMGMFRDGDLGDPSETNSSSYYLPYIPSGPADPNVIYQFTDYDELAEQIQLAGLSKYAGGYAPKNSSRTPWVTRSDLRIEQEIPGFSRDHRGIIYLEILNLYNLLDSDKGKVLDNRFRTSQRTLVDFGGIDPNTGQYIYVSPFGGYNDGQKWDQFVAEESQWRLKLGLRYRF